MIKKAIGIVAALALFAAGTMLIIGYVRNTEARIVAEAQPTQILVVSQPVEAGVSPDGALRIEEYPARLVSDDSLRPGDTLNGLVATVDLLPGEPMVWSRLAEPDAVDHGERTRIPVPDGLSAVTISMSAGEIQRAVGGLLAPGMTVSVVASFETAVNDPENDTTHNMKVTHAIVQKALVVEVQSDDPFDVELVGQQAADLPGASDFLVTLAVPIYDVERVIFASEWGRVWLAEQGLHATEETFIQTMATVLDQVDPEDPPEPNGLSSGRPSAVLPFAEPLDDSDRLDDSRDENDTSTADTSKPATGRTADEADSEDTTTDESEDS